MTRDLIRTVAGPKGQPPIQLLPLRYDKCGFPLFRYYQDTPVRRMFALAHLIKNQLNIERDIELHAENRRLTKNIKEILGNSEHMLGVKYTKISGKGCLVVNKIKDNEIEGFKASSKEIQEKMDKKFPVVKPSQPDLNPFQKDFLMKFFDQLFALVEQVHSLMGRIFTAIFP